MAFENTQLTSATGYDVKNLIFGKPKDGSIPNSTVAFKRMAIGTRNPDGTIGELVIQTSRIFSFGLSPNVNMQTGKADGYSLALCLYNQDSPSAEEKAWVDTFNKIVDSIKQYLVDHRDDLSKYELEMGDLKNLNPLYYKKEKGKIVPGTGPMLYPKVLQNKKTEAITSVFFNERGDDMDPMSLIGKRCHITAAIKIESIFIGAKISLQIKVQEAEVKLQESGVKRLLRRPQANSEVVMESKADVDDKEDEIETNDSNDSDDHQSIKGDSDEEDEKPAEPAPVPQPVAAKPAAATRRTTARKA